MHLKLFLTQTFYYFNSSRNKWIYIFSSTLFVFFFLILFQPYGISEEVNNPINSNSEILLFFFSISVSTFTGLSLSQFVLRPFIFKRSMSNGNYIIWLLLEAFIITLIMFFFSLIIPDLGNDFENELNLLFQLRNYFRCLIILLFPFFGSLVFVLVEKMTFEIKELSYQIKQYTDHFTSKQKAEIIHLKDENGQADFSGELNKILYLESSNQYVLIHYLDKSKVKKHIIRNRMKAVLEQTKGLPFQRCHRSFAINLLNVKYMSRNKDKEFLVTNTDPVFQIPVSKSYLKKIKEELSSV